MDVKLRLVRVKRKRDSAAPEDLVVEGLLPPHQKRSRGGALEAAMAELGRENAGEAGRSWQRFRRVDTISWSTASQASSAQHLLQTLTGEEAPARAQDGARGSPPAPGRQPDTEPPEQPGRFFERAAHQAARYQHVQHRRRLAPQFERQVDAYDELFDLYDVNQVYDAGQCSTWAAGRSHILCDGQPMICESMPGETAPMEDDAHYVYDLYTAVDEDTDEERRRQLPTVRIFDDEDWLVEDASDAEDSAADSEDSNAEGFHTHEYPEDDFGSDSAVAHSEASDADSEDL